MNDRQDAVLDMFQEVARLFAEKTKATSEVHHQKATQLNVVMKKII